MVDLILFLFVCAVFAAGFWAGKTFRTYGAAIDSAKAWYKTQVAKLK